MTSAEVPRALVREAAADPGLRGRVRARDPRRVGLVVDGQIVGFITPHLSARGEGRFGPIYVTPAYRGRGLLRAAYAAIDGWPMLAAILDVHEASQRAHEQSGFVRSHRFARGWFYRRAAHSG